MLKAASSPKIFKQPDSFYYQNGIVLNCFNCFFRVWDKEAAKNWYLGYHPSKTVPFQNG